MTGSVSHPLFARLYPRTAAGAEKAGGADHRRELLSGLSGRVIEVGAGFGLNFGYYPPTVTELAAVEPEHRLRRRAAEAAHRAAIAITVQDATAEHLPFGDGSFDAGVASLVLCSVPDQEAALAELYRVIRSGGELRFYEHVRADSPRFARMQDRVDRIWPWLNGGCHPNRDTEAAIECAGFRVEDHRRFLFQPLPIGKPAAPHVIGRARRP